MCDANKRARVSPVVVSVRYCPAVRAVLAHLATTRGRVLLLVALVIVAVSLGAVIVMAVGDFDDYPEAVWWAFRHVVDPGALGDDDHWDERVVGTALTMTGLVVFLGIVLTVVTDVVQRALERLEDQPPSLRVSDHTVILGWGSLTPLVLDEIATLRRSDPTMPSRVVVVASASMRGERDRLNAELRSHRRDFAGDVRFAETDDVEALAAVSVWTARSVLVVPDDLDQADPLATDLDVIGRASVLARALDVPGHATGPLVIFLVNSDEGYASAAATLPPSFVGITGDRAITGMLRLSLVSPPWGAVLTGAMDLGTEDLFGVGEPGAAAGHTFAEVSAHVDHQLPLGVYAAGGEFTTDGGHEIAAGDRIVWVRTAHAWGPPVVADPDIVIDDDRHVRCRLLIVGFNHRVPTLLDDLLAQRALDVEVVNVSDLPAPQRRAQIPQRLIDATTCELVEAPLRDADDCRALLHEVRPDRVLVVSTPRADSTSANLFRAADASAVFLAGRIGSVQDGAVPVVVDLFEPASGPVADGLSSVRAIPAARLQAFTLARAISGASSSDLVTAVFGDDDAPPFVGSVRTPDGAPRTFAAVRAAAVAHGSSVLGVVVDGEIEVAPPPDRPVPSGAELLLLRGSPVSS